MESQEMNTSTIVLDQTDYLRGLIKSYQELIDTKGTKGTLLNTNRDLEPFIKEELFKCTYKLHRIREVDIEELLKGNARLCPLEDTN